MADAAEPRDAQSDITGRAPGWSAKLARWWRTGNVDSVLAARHQAETALESAAAAHDGAAEAHRTAATAHRAAADFADDLGAVTLAGYHRDAAVRSDRDATFAAGAADKAWGDALAFRARSSD